MNATASKTNPAALAVLPLTVLMTLSALLPYFTAGDYYSGYSFSISGWSFFSTVDLLMLLSILLAALLLAVALTPQLREGKVRISLGGGATGRFEFPLILVPAAAVGLTAGLIFLLLALRVLSPPDGFEQGAGLIIGAFLAMASTGAAAAAIGIEVTPRRVAAAVPPAGPAPAAPAAQPPPSPQQRNPAPPQAPTLQDPPPPAPGTRRG